MKPTYRITIFLTLMVLLFCLYKYQNKIVANNNNIIEESQPGDMDIDMDMDMNMDMDMGMDLDSNKDSIDQITIDNVSQLSFKSDEDIYEPDMDSQYINDGASFASLDSRF